VQQQQQQSIDSSGNRKKKPLHGARPYQLRSIINTHNPYRANFSPLSLSLLEKYQAYDMWAGSKCTIKQGNRTGWVLTIFSIYDWKYKALKWHSVFSDP